MTDQDYIGVLYAGHELQNICHNASAKAGWWTDLSTGEPIELTKTLINEKLLLIVTEIAEATEGNRKDKMDDHLPQYPMLIVELADAVIRIGDLAGKLQEETGINFGEVIAAKMEYNSNRQDHKIENRLKDGGKKV